VWYSNKKSLVSKKGFRMKRMLLFVVICLLAVPVLATEQPVAPAAAKEAALPVVTVTARIGVVDINKVSVESAMGKAAQSQIKSQQSKLQKQIEAKRKQLDAFKADTERQFPTLSPQQREAKSKEFQKKIEAFQKFGMGAEKDLITSQQKLNKGLFEAIEKAAEELGKAKGLSALVIKRELLYLGAGVESIDMTADLVTLLDEKGAKK
jgi:outer membrane protein